MQTQSKEIIDKVLELNDDITLHDESIAGRLIINFKCLGCDHKFSGNIQATGAHKKIASGTTSCVVPSAAISLTWQKSSLQVASVVPNKESRL